MSGRRPAPGGNVDPGSFGPSDARYPRRPSSQRSDASITTIDESRASSEAIPGNIGSSVSGRHRSPRPSTSNNRPPRQTSRDNWQNRERARQAEPGSSHISAPSGLAARSRLELAPESLERIALEDRPASGSAAKQPVGEPSSHRDYPDIKSLPGYRIIEGANRCFRSFEMFTRDEYSFIWNENGANRAEFHDWAACIGTLDGEPRMTAVDPRLLALPTVAARIVGMLDAFHTEYLNLWEVANSDPCVEVAQNFHGTEEELHKAQRRVCREQIVDVHLAMGILKTALNGTPMSPLIPENNPRPPVQRQPRDRSRNPVPNPRRFVGSAGPEGMSSSSIELEQYPRREQNAMTAGSIPKAKGDPQSSGHQQRGSRPAGPERSTTQDSHFSKDSGFCGSSCCFPQGSSSRQQRNEEGQGQ